MNIFPAIDLYNNCAVRLFKGDYEKMTIYSENPLEIAKDFEKCGATHIHMVDLEGAKFATTPNLEIVKSVASETNLFVEIGGGIRSLDTMNTYFDAGVDRVILGTAAVENEELLKTAVEKYQEKIAVGADIKDGYVAVKGWLEKSQFTLDAFCEKMQSLGVKYIICTDISKDGAMRGTNREMYRDLKKKYSMNITASGGVSSLDDVLALKELDIYGAIIGKAYYTGDIELSEAVKLGEAR